MAYTVASAFDGFFEAINLTGDHRETANARRDKIVSLLKNDFDILDAFSTGSIPKFTALKQRADLDVMVVLHFGKHIEGKTPTQVLDAVRKCLSGYRSGVRKNGQAVTLYYETWPNVDIVPVSRCDDNLGNVSHYSVPNTYTGNWMSSRPALFAKAIDDRAKTCGPNFRRIVKMVKHWNAVHSDLLTGYHIEALALKVFSDNLDDTPWQVLQFFDKARPLLQSLLFYDLSFVDDYLTPADREKVLKRFDTAIETSRTAWYHGAVSSPNHQEAITHWRTLFADKFPAYG